MLKHVTLRDDLTCVIVSTGADQLMLTAGPGMMPPNMPVAPGMVPGVPAAPQQYGYQPGYGMWPSRRPEFRLTLPPPSSRLYHS